KQDLFLALLDERVEERADAIRAHFATPGGPAEIVEQARGAADEAFAAVRPNREWRLLTLEFALHAARDSAFARRYAEREDAIRNAIEEVLRASLSPRPSARCLRQGPRMPARAARRPCGHGRRGRPGQRPQLLALPRRRRTRRRRRAGALPAREGDGDGRTRRCRNPSCSRRRRASPAA